MSRLLSIRRAARAVRKRPATISAAVARAEIPGYREGSRTILVDLDDVVAWLKRYRVTPEGTARAATDHARRVVGEVLSRGRGEASK